MAQTRRSDGGDAGFLHTERQTAICRVRAGGPACKLAPPGGREWPHQLTP